MQMKKPNLCIKPCEKTFWTFENTREFRDVKKTQACGLFYTFPSCSKMLVVFYHSAVVKLCVGFFIC